MNLDIISACNQRFGVKIFVIFSLFLVAVSCSFTALFIHNQTLALSETLIRNGKLLTAVLAHNARLGVFSENENLLQEVMGAVLKQEGVQDVLIFNGRGEILAHEQRFGDPVPALEDENRQPIFRRLSKEGPPFYVDRGSHALFWAAVVAGAGYENEESLVLATASPQRSADVIGYVRIAVTKRIYEEKLGALFPKIILIALLCLVSGSVIIYLLVQRIMRPLNRLTANVRALGEGAAVQTVAVETGDEIGNLAQAFNDMYASLQIREKEKQQLEEQLRHAQKMEAVGTLAGGIAHDFNNLLMAIQGNASLMLMGLDRTHPHYQKIRNIETYVRNGSDLTAQLLGFSRAGKYQARPTNLNAMIGKSVEMFGRTRKEIQIHTQCEPGIWPVEVDRSQIEQVLLNLFVNAWHAMPKGGHLYVQTAAVQIGDAAARLQQVAPGRYVKITVRDTGVGMDPAVQERIFEPFFTTREMGRGAGLGLASAYGIIRNHGGLIDVRSKVGKGTTFDVYLPATDKAVVEDHVENRRPLRGRELVLLVDDEEMILEVGRDFLQRIGYEVLTAQQGSDAIAIFKQRHEDIELVILDMIMPDMCGGEVYQRLQTIDSNVKTLLSSGYSLDERTAEIMAMGCDGFIQKPFNMEDLSYKIREIIGESQNGTA